MLMCNTGPFNIDISTLKIYYFNTTLGDWQLETNTNVDQTNNYVWANVTHFSLFGAFGSAPSPPGGGSGGGGGGGSIKIEEICTSSWKCTHWTTCSKNNIQKIKLGQ